MTSRMSKISKVSIKRNKFWLLTTALILSGCQSDEDFKGRVEKTLKKNPEIVYKIIEENPKDFLDSFQKAITATKGEQRKQQALKEKTEREELFKNPLKPKIRKDESFRGNPKAPITIVEYVDFQCPFCLRGHNTLEEIRKELKEEVRVVYKHLPLAFHGEAQIAAQYFEAIRLQDKEKAFRFNDQLFNNQGKLKKGEPFLKSLAKKINVDMKRLKEDVHSRVVLKRIEEDKKEAASLRIQGTPGFVLNGIPIRGAYPKAHFLEIIAQLKKRNLIRVAAE